MCIVLTLSIIQRVFLKKSLKPKKKKNPPMASMIFTLLTLLWWATFVCVSATPMINDLQPRAFLANDNVELMISATFIDSLESVTLSGPNNSIIAASCHPGDEGWNITITPCLWKQTRDAICIQIGTAIWGAGSIFNSCTNTQTPCVQYADYNGPCPAVAQDDIDYDCNFIRCFLTAPENTCVEFELVNVPSKTLNGTECGSAGPELVCGFGNHCVDVHAPSCPMTTSCTMETPSIAGMYNLTFLTRSDGNLSAVPIQVLPYPVPVTLATAQNQWAIASDSVFLSPGSSFDVEYNYPAAAINATITVGWVNANVAVSAPTLTNMTFQIVYHDLQNFTAMTPSFISVLLLPIPAVYSICPLQILSQINSSVVVSGAMFANTPQLRCVVDGEFAPVAYLNDHAVECTVFAANLTNSISFVTVTNDALTPAPYEAALQVEGSCSVRKPHSVVHDNACECTPGYSANDGACTPCPDGTYQPNYEQASCIPCDSSEDTGGTVGNTDASACVCRDGRYRASPADTTCKLCTTGMLCEDGKVSVLPGFWRASTETFIVVKCSEHQAACAGGTGGGDSLCKSGYQGPLCETCAAGFGAAGGLACVQCQGQGVNVLIVVLMVGGIAVFLWLVIKATTTVSDRHDTTAAVVKILWTYLQILYYIGRISAHWSQDSSSFFASIVPASLSPSFLYIQCASQFDFYQRITFTMLLPLTVSAALLCVYALVVLKKWLEAKMRHLGDIVYDAQISYRRALLVILYMIHPMLALDVISALRCDAVPGTGDTFVQTDLTVSCSTPAYAAFVTVACIFIVVYLIGGICAVAFAVNKHKADILLANQGSALIKGQRYVYFVKGYKNECFLYELAVMGRKLGIVICSAMLPVGLQLVWSSLIIGASLSYTVMWQPWSSFLVNRLDIVALCALLVTLILGFHSIFIRSSSANIPIFVFLLLVNLLVFAGLFFIAMTKVTKKLRVLANWILAFIDDRMQVDDVSDIKMTTRDGVLSMRQHSTPQHEMDVFPRSSSSLGSSSASATSTDFLQEIQII
jgi:hypothetical protein